ncbi:MAG TPA: M23 family metallopeptidase [Trueperaceae bacterium]
MRSVADTWGGPRDGGSAHEGQDIFAPVGTPVLAAAPGFVYRIGDQRRGGNVVIVVAAGGHRHYYAHLDSFADIREGQWVDDDTVPGYVGNSGNAAGTPPHLHFGVYASGQGGCDWNAIDPLPLLIDRPPP